MTSVNNTAINTNVQVSVWVSTFNYFFAYTDKNGITGSYGNSIFKFFWLTNKYCSHQLHHSTFPPTMQKISNFSTSWPKLAIFFCFVVCLFVSFCFNSHPERCAVIRHMHFQMLSFYYNLCLTLITRITCKNSNIVFFCSFNI